MKSLKALAGLTIVIACSAVQADEANQTAEANPPAEAAQSAEVNQPAQVSQAAGAWHINLHTVSHHFSERKHGKTWNEENLGLGIRREFSSNFSVQAGFYRNSIDRWSTYAIGEYTPLTFGNLHSGVYAGLRTNYTRPVMAAAGALVRWQGERYSVTVRAAPKTCGQCSAFIALEFGWKL
ncbi:MAG: hypothetical protein L0H10_17050 [Comamonas sp.]|uniref:hypothetical protein n=1 Tax=Comamonas sp. TaxID=34028 RepID=UPI002647A39E|nr:hypothetical protein [Comamonas sp.]MDN5505499.1 hypothetical protein [Comamonas sp.]MDN5539352.1 hypothetical protein [Comamonas sp.]